MGKAEKGVEKGRGLTRGCTGADNRRSQFRQTGQRTRHERRKGSEGGRQRSVGKMQGRGK
jgi:hypothetical protein